MRTILLLVAAALLQLISAFFAVRPDLLPPGAFYYVRAAAIVGTALLLVRLVAQGLIEVVLPRLMGRRPDDIFRVMILGVCYGVGGAVVMRLAFGQDMATILTASALFTAIIGLALQATLNNLFSGTALQLERSFRIGDFVRIGAAQGHIEALTWRAVHLRTIDNSLLIIPNSQLNTTVVEVFRADARCRHVLRLPAPLAAPPTVLLGLIETMLATLAAEGRLDEPGAALDSFAANEGAAWYRVTYHTGRYLDGVAIEAEIRTRYWYALSRRGLAIATSSIYAASVKMPDDRAEIAAALAGLPDYRGQDGEALAALAGRTGRLAFAASEPIRLPPDSEPAELVLFRGAISLPDAPDQAADGEMREAAGKLAYWQPSALAAVTAEFAAIIGPIAELLVKRAADRTRDPYRLYHRLADHIDDASQRAAFLAGAPAAAAHILEPNVRLSWETLATAGGQPARAIGHTELLVLPRLAPAAADVPAG